MTSTSYKLLIPLSPNCKIKVHVAVYIRCDITLLERATSDNVNTVLIENGKGEGIAEQQLASITNILNIVCLAITQSRPPLELYLPIATFVASLLISPSIVRHSPVYSSSSSPSSLGMTGFSKQASPRSSPTKA